MPGPWQPYLEAPCGRTIRVVRGFKSGWFKSGTCPKCGDYHGEHDFKHLAIRTTFLGTWWKPWTWFKFKEEIKK